MEDVRIVDVLYVFTRENTEMCVPSRPSHVDSFVIRSRSGLVG